MDVSEIDFCLSYPITKHTNMEFYSTHQEKTLAKKEAKREASVSQVDAKRLIWDVSNSQYSPILTHSTLQAVPKYLESVGREKLSPEGWRWNSELEPLVKKDLDSHQSTKSLVEYMLDECGNEDDDTSMLSVVVADDFDMIQEKTKKWPVSIDPAANQFPCDGNTLFSASRIKIQKSGWKDYGIHVSDTRSPHPDGGHFVKLSTDKNVKLEKDQSGFTTMTYRLGDIKIRLTDLTTNPGLETVPTFHEILDAHACGIFTPLDYNSGEFHSFYAPINNAAVRPLLGADNAGWTVVGAQCAGFMQVNKQQPCNLDAASIAVVRYRGLSLKGQESDYKFYRMTDDGQVYFTMLVEVIVGDKAVIGFLTDETHVRGSAD